MTVRKRIVARHPDGRVLTEISGDPLHWRYDGRAEAFMHETKDGVVYAIKRSTPTGVDRMGHKLYRYWQARCMLNGEIVNLGDEHMIAREGQDVCELYESARLEDNVLHSKSKDRLVNDDTGRQSKDQHQTDTRRFRRLLSNAGPNGDRGKRS